jgi:hypothetical protein
MNMRRRMLAAALVLAFSAALFGAAFAQGKPAGKPPRLVIDKMTVQLGEMMEGQDFLHTFKIKNAGEGKLQILSVKPG